LREAAHEGDVFVTVTGNVRVIRKEHMLSMKDGVIIANTGHFNVEVSIPGLEEIASSKRSMRPNLEEYVLKDGRRIYLLAKGRLVNLASAEGHPSEVMDMSFSNQALCVEHIAKNPRMDARVYSVPREIDDLVARLKLEGIGIKIDEMTDEQKTYISSWEAGTV
jgi:adenosylhomocysteinase